jgi:DNA-binding LacI/PurR family transcriptional regulator
MQSMAGVTQAGLTWTRKSRPTIALFISDITHPWERRQWSGVVDAAHDSDVNLICFTGEALCHPHGFTGQRNALYDLVDEETIDGLVMWLGGFDSFVDREKIGHFCRRYRLPTVAIEREVTGIPSVLMDDYQAMREAIQHLIQCHGYQRVAFIAGSRSQGHHLGTQERHRAYVDTMAEYGLPCDPSWTIPGMEAVPEWLSGGRIPDVEAVVAHADEHALFASQELQALGAHVPDEVAIVGFNDTEEARAAWPPLTSVRPPFYEMGRQAVELVLAMIAGEEVPERVVLPSDLIVRSSCGCPSQAVVEAAAELPSTAGPVEADRETLHASLAAQRGEILAEMAEAVGEPGDSVDPTWAEHLLDAFVTDLSGESGGTFLAALDGILRQAATADGDLSAWHGTLSALRRRLLPCLDSEALRRADGLWQQARVVVGDAVERTLIRRQLEAEQQAQTLAEIGASLIITFDVEQLMDVLADEVPRLGIPSIYLALYENPQPYVYPQPAPEWSRLVLAYDERGRLEIDPEGQRFPSHSLLPAGILPRERRQVLVLEPLFFREQQLGFVLLEVGPQDGAVYESLRGRISSALQGALLMQQVKEHALQLDTAVSETLTTVQEMQATVTQTAEQARAVADAAQRSADISQAGQAVVADTVAGMETIEQQVKAIEGDILALSERTGQIGEIIAVVKRIADQSHLLALNANIEAARLGSQGRGFAVVAKEMRDLAGQSREATSRVRDILTEIQRATHTAVMITKEGSKSAQDGVELASRAGEAIRDLSATIEKAAQAATHIASTTYQQTTGMNRLAEAMQAIKQASTQTTMSTQQAGQSAESSQP